MAFITRRLRRQHLRQLSSSTITTKAPLLYKSPNIINKNDDTTVALQLLSWGRGASGQLGTSTCDNKLYPTPISTLLTKQHSNNNSNSVMIACGLFHSGLVVDGNLWVWGKGDGGRLGLGHENSMLNPTLNPNFHHHHGVMSIALGGVHSVALTTKGQVFTWWVFFVFATCNLIIRISAIFNIRIACVCLIAKGKLQSLLGGGYGGFGALGHHVYTRELLPRLVEGSWSGKICQVSTSGTHTAAITESGELYTWGRDQGDGRLGLGPRPGPNEGGGFSIPSKVEALPVPVASVYCGGFFTMVLTKDGEIWNWGANSNYELGRGDKIGGWKPQQISSLAGVRIIQVVCGGYHSLALTEDGKVLSWGYGGLGQLGHSSIQNEKEPKVVEALIDERVVYIACGGTSSAAVTDEGKLYMWGNAKDSQLGIPGLPEVQTFPVEVKFLSEDDTPEPYKVLSVAIGASHAMCSNVGMSTCFWFLIVKFNASRRETAKILAAACKEKATMYQLSYLVLATANKFDFESAKLFLSCRICVNTPW
ncbi:hypothetical protein ACFE04_029491 [Oxalis oulophora]